MSVRESTFRLSWICSGDMYFGVPTSDDVTVMFSESSSPSSCVSFEMPKSSTLMRGLAVELLRQKEVRRLQVAVDDAAHVRFRERLARLRDVLDDLRQRHRPARRQLAREIATFEELHHHVRLARRERADVRHTRDVLARKPCERATFAKETLDHFAIGHDRGVEHLERHAVTELQVRRLEDEPHPAFANEAFGAVLVRDYAPNGQRRRRLFLLLRSHRRLKAYQIKGALESLCACRSRRKVG